MSQDFSEDSEFDDQQDTYPEPQLLPFLSINFVQQVDELVSLAHYGPSIVLVLGDDGMGKSCVIEQIENETSEIGQIRVDGNPMLGIDQLHASFLQQLNNYQQTVEFNSVRDSLLRASEISEQLILVDDAQQLSASVLESLISLVSPIEQSPSVPVRLFLFGNSDLKQQINMDSFPSTAIYCLTLKGFAKDEIAPFLGHQLNLSDEDVEDSFDSKSINQIWKNSQGNPGKIIHNLIQDDIELDDVEEINPSRLPSILFRSFLAVVGVTLLLLAVFGENWLQHDQPIIEPTNTITEETIATPENKTSAPAEQNQPIPESVTTTDPKLQQQTAAEEEDTLPLETATIQNNDAETITSSESSETVGDLDTVESTQLQPQQQPAENTSQDETNTAAVLEEEPAATFNQEQQTEAPKSIQQAPQIPPPTTPQISYSADEEYLLSQPANRYAVQLMGLINLQELQVFANQLSLSQDHYIYRSLFKGKPWFIIVSGNYPDAETARQAKDQFPSEIQKLDPWIKSFAKIQAEIRSAAEKRK